MTFKTWQDKAQHAHAVAERIGRMAHANARRIMLAAGVSDPNCLHNALVSAEWGTPWAEVNYSLARRARREFDRQFRAYDLACAYTARLWDEHRRSGE